MAVLRQDRRVPRLDRQELAQTMRVRWCAATTADRARDEDRRGAAICELVLDADIDGEVPIFGLPR